MEPSTKVVAKNADAPDASIPLNNARHEKFCQNLATGMSQADAYLEAGFKSHDANSARFDASRLLATSGNVASRVRWLKQQAADNAIMTATDVANTAWAIASDPSQNPNARVSALALLAKQFPEFSDKLDARVLHGIVKVERGTRGLNGG